MYIHLVMMKLIKGATSAVAAICNHDFYGFIASVPTDVLTAINENTDVLTAIVENTDVRGTISTDSTDVLAAITVNTDVLGEVC